MFILCWLLVGLIGAISCMLLGNKMGGFPTLQLLDIFQIMIFTLFGPVMFFALLFLIYEYVRRNNIAIIK